MIALPNVIIYTYQEHKVYIQNKIDFFYVDNIGNETENINA